VFWTARKLGTVSRCASALLYCLDVHVKQVSSVDKSQSWRDHNMNKAESAGNHAAFQPQVQRPPSRFSMTALRRHRPFVAQRAKAASLSPEGLLPIERTSLDPIDSRQNHRGDGSGSECHDRCVQALSVDARDTRWAAGWYSGRGVWERISFARPLGKTAVLRPSLRPSRMGSSVSQWIHLECDSIRYRGSPGMNEGADRNSIRRGCSSARALSA